MAPPRRLKVMVMRSPGLRALSAAAEPAGGQRLAVDVDNHIALVEPGIERRRAPGRRPLIVPLASTHSRTGADQAAPDSASQQHVTGAQEQARVVDDLAAFDVTVKKSSAKALSPDTSASRARASASV